MLYKKLKKYQLTFECILKKAKNWFFAPVLLITSLTVFVPFAPDMPGESLDPSWMFGVNQAVAQGLVFGKDIIFTFGPYSSIYTKAFNAATDHLMVWGGFYLGVSFFVVAYLNFKDSKWYLRVGLLLVLAGLMYSRDALFFFYPLLVGVFLFKVIAIDGGEHNSSKRWYGLLVIMFFPLGLLPLIKGSSLIPCLAMVVLVSTFLLKWRAWASLIVACISPILAMLLFWWLADQPLHGLPVYFKSMIPIISGYTEAMAISGRVGEWLLYVLGGVVLVGSIFVDAKGKLLDRLIITSMFFVVLFFAFKAGFVRHDGHAITSGTTILLVSLLALTLTFGTRGVFILISAFVVWGNIDAHYVQTSAKRFAYNVKATYLVSFDGLKERVLDEDKLGRDFAKSIAVLKLHGGFPLLEGTTDIYSFDQSYLIASGNKWNPRPVFQSYSVYTAGLVEKNKNHLLGKNRPDNIFFKLQPIDGRAPSLEDGASWPELISGYQPVGFINSYLLLKHRLSNMPYKMNVVENGVYSFGDKINLQAYDKPIFAKIYIKPTVLGSIFNVLFKPSKLIVTFVMNDGVKRRYRLVSKMAETGFLISPLIENTEEYGLLYVSPAYLDNKKVKSIIVSSKGLRFLWNTEFKVELLSMDYEPNHEYMRLYKFSQPVNEDAFQKISNADRCGGSIDSINGISPAPALFKTRFLLDVNGWLAKSVEKGELPDDVYLVLTDGVGKRLFIKTKSTQRSDVGIAFNKRSLDSSGYTVVADVSMLKGAYVMGLAYSDNGTLNICPQFNIPGFIRAD